MTTLELTVEQLALRDQFAASALTALIQSDFARSVSHPDKAAQDAYRFADAMLAQRTREQQSQ